MKKLVGHLIKRISKPIFIVRWRWKNRHNGTIPQNVFPVNKVLVGIGTYGPLNVITYGNPEERLFIGNYCSIAGEVEFILGGEHSHVGISTFPFKVKFMREPFEARTKGPIKVEDDVWIGQRATILSGVTIGKGAIIGAGSIVRRNVPPYAIYVGQEVVAYRFSEDTKEKLLQFDFEKLTPEVIRENIRLLYEDAEKVVDTGAYSGCIASNKKLDSREYT